MRSEETGKRGHYGSLSVLTLFPVRATHYLRGGPKRPGGSLNLEIVIQPLDGSRLVQDYLRLEPALASFYSGSPWDLEAYERKVEEVAARFDARARRRAAAAIHATSARARERLERLVREGGAFVTTGQQPGLFTGPLYAIYKALAAVRLADALERTLGVVVLPLFWIASEDHDWAEVSQVTIVDPTNEVRRRSVEAPDDRALPVHARVLGREIEDAVEEFLGFLPETEFTPQYAELLRDSYRAGRSLADAFRMAFGRLMAEFDLLLVDAAHAIVKQGAADIVRHEAESAEAHEALLRKQTERIVAAGYHVQVPVLEGALNLFLEGPAGRERIFREEGAYRLRRSGALISADALRRLLEREIDRFSPNVLLRPVVESALFPVLAYVAGPAELSYYAQIGCLFDAHAIQMPLIFPRFSVVLLEAKVRKVLDKFELELGELARPLHELAAERARKELPEKVTKALSVIRRALGEGTARLLEGVKSIDPTLKGPVIGARNQALAAFQEAERKVLQGVKRQEEVALAQIAKAQVHLFPEGQPQERVHNVFYYLVRYGPELLPAIAERLEIELGRTSPFWRGVECGAA